jgi:hypothetical protein
MFNEESSATKSSLAFVVQAEFLKYKDKLNSE